MGLFKTKGDVSNKPSKKELKELKKLEKKGKKNGNVPLQTFENPSVSPQPQNFNNSNQFQQVGGYPNNNFPQENDLNQYHQQPPVYQQQDPGFGMNQQPQQPQGGFVGGFDNGQAQGQQYPEFNSVDPYQSGFNEADGYPSVNSVEMPQQVQQNNNFYQNDYDYPQPSTIPTSSNVYNSNFDESLNPGMNPAIGNFVSQAQPTKVDVTKLEGIQQSINLKTANFEFEEDYNPRQETIKEGMAPSAYSRGEIDFLIVGSKYARVFCIEGLPDQVYIGYLRRLYSSDYDLDINLSIQPRQQSEARKELQDKLTIVRAQLEEEIERGANRNRDTFQEQIDKLEYQIAELATRNEFAFEAQFLFTLYADSREELSRNTIALMQELKEEHITPQVLALRQDEGYRTVVPYAIDYLQDKKRNFNTGAVISSIPFYIPELYDDYGLYLGTNTFSGTPALLDMYKKGIPNSNLNVFGTSGSGKSTLVKFLTMRSSLHGIRTVIIDPEGEYGAMTNKLHGAVFRMSTDPTRAVMMNLFDIEEDVDINPTTGEQVPTLELRPKYEDISGFIKVIYPDMDKGQEANLLEVIEELYFRFGFKNNDVDSLYENGDIIVENGVLINNFRKKPMPILSDLIDLMQNFVYDGTYPNLREVVDALQPYRNNKTRGMFDTQTPKEFQNLRDLPVITFDISGIESSDLKTLSMYVLLNWVWEKFGKKNPHIKKRILVDEAWMMMSPSQNGYQYTSAFLETMSRRIRKRNGGLCVASQRVDDFNQTQQGQAVITNAHTTFLLNHQESEVPALRKAFNLDEGVIANIIQTEIGRVLIKQGTHLYIVNTNIFDSEKRVVVTSPQNLSK